MVKSNKNTGSKGIWASLESSKPQTLERPEPPEQKIDNESKSRNLDCKITSKDCRKPKRYSSKNGEEFTVGKGIVLTQEVNRNLNMVKALSNNLTYNEIIDEALHEYFAKLL